MDSSSTLDMDRELADGGGGLALAETGRVSQPRRCEIKGLSAPKFAPLSGAWSLERAAACRCMLGTLALPTAQKLVAGVPGNVKTPGLSASGPGPKNRQVEMCMT